MKEETSTCNLTIHVSLFCIIHVYKFEKGIFLKNPDLKN